MFPQLRQLVVFPDQPSSTRRPTAFHVLLELDNNGFIAHLRVRQRTVPTPEEIATLGVTLSASISAEHVPAHASDRMADQHGIPAEVIDDRLGDTSTWGIQEAATARLLAMPDPPDPGEPISRRRDRVMAGIESELCRRVDTFIGALDSEILAIAATFTEPLPSHYNYLVGGSAVLRRNRCQALLAYPWLAAWAVFGKNDQAIRRRVRLAIDQGQPLRRMLPELLECSPSVIRTISAANPASLRQRWQRDIPGLARQLESIKADYRPRCDDDWMRFHEAVRMIEQTTGEPVTVPQNQLWLATAARRGYSVPLPEGQDASVLMAGIAELQSALVSALVLRVFPDSMCGGSFRDPAPALAEAIRRALGSLTFVMLADAVRRYHAEYRREALATNCDDITLRGHAWPAPSSELVTADRSIVPLLTPQALNAEGQAMEHCVGSYVSHCARGTRQIWSIRTLEGERCATLSTQFVAARHRSGWRVKIEQLSARGNQVPDEASCAAAVALIRQLDSGGEQVAAYQRWLAEVAHLDLKERTERVGMRVRARAVERAMTGRLAVDKLVAAIAETTAQGNARLSPSVTEQHHATREPA